MNTTANQSTTEISRTLRAIDVARKEETRLKDSGRPDLARRWASIRQGQHERLVRILKANGVNL